MVPYAPAVWNIVEMLLHITCILTYGNNASLYCTETPKQARGFLFKEERHLNIQATIQARV